MSETVNIRVRRNARDKLKVKAAQSKMSLVDFLDVLSVKAEVVK